MSIVGYRNTFDKLLLLILALERKMSLRQSRDELIKRGVLKEIFEKGEVNVERLIIYHFLNSYSLIFLFKNLTWSIQRYNLSVLKFCRSSVPSIKKILYLIRTKSVPQGFNSKKLARL